MNVRMFAVNDRTAGAFHAPFLAQTEGVACRLMADMVNRPGHPYNLHPGDYTLCEVGEFDELMGVVMPCAVRPITALSTFVKMEG